MRRKKPTPAPPMQPMASTMTPPKPERALTEDALWTFLADLIAMRAQQAMWTEVKNGREKARGLRVYGADLDQANRVRAFAIALTNRERELCRAALTAAVPSHADQIEKVLAARSDSLGYTFTWALAK